MAREASALTNVEENTKEGNPVENVQDLVKQQNERINQIATQLQFLMERVIGPNDHSPGTPSSSNMRGKHTSSVENEARIDQILHLSCTNSHRDCPNKVASFQNVAIEQIWTSTDQNIHPKWIWFPILLNINLILSNHT